MWRRLRNIHVMLHVRANGDSPVSLAMTRMRWSHGQKVGGLRGRPDWCSIKDAGRSERETPTPCAGERKRQKEWEKRGVKQKTKTTTHEGQRKQHSCDDEKRHKATTRGNTWLIFLVHGQAPT